MTHRVDGMVMGVDDIMNGVKRKAQDVRGDVQDVDRRVTTIGGISIRAQGVDDKIDQVNRSLSLLTPAPLPSTHTLS